MKRDIKVVSKSVSLSGELGEAHNFEWFAEKFSACPSYLREDKYKVGLLPPPVWQSFLKLPRPMVTEFWLAVNNENEVLGRVGANLSPSHPHTGNIGFFEVSTSESSATLISQKLLETATDWLKNNNVTQVFGPLNINTWFSYRFRTSEDQSPLFAWEPVNPPEYYKFFQEFGFKDAENYLSDGLDDVESLLASTKPSYDEALVKGYSFRTFDGPNLLEVEVPILYRISMSCFKNNFLFEPIPFETFKQLYVPVANKINSSLSCYLVDPSGKEIGFMFAFKDQDYIVLKTIAMGPEGRGLGLSNGMVYSSVKEGYDRGFRKVITALIRQGAQSQSYGKKAKLLWRHNYALMKKEI